MNEIVKDKIKTPGEPFKAVEFLATITGEVIIQSFFGPE